MTTKSKLNFIFDMLDEENLSKGNKNETIPCLRKTKNLLKSTSPSIDQHYFADNSSEKEEESYLFSHNDFSEAIQKRLDQYSDDEYSFLKKEIDSYIKVNDEEELNMKKSALIAFTAKKKSESSEADIEIKQENYLKDDFSIWQKKRKSSNNLTHLKFDDFSEKSKIFIPKKHKLESHQKEKLKDLTIDTNNILENVLKKNNSNSTTDLNSEDKVFANVKSNRNSKSFLELKKNNFSNSSFSTAYNSLCSTPISSPEADVKKTLNVNHENLIFSKNSISNKNLYETFFDDSNFNGSTCTNSNDTFKICHINSLCTKSDVELKNISPQNYYMNSNFNGSAVNKSNFNSKVNSVNNNSNSNLINYDKSSSSKKLFYPLNPNALYDTTNICNNSLIYNNNYVHSSIYNNTQSFCQVPIYQNQMYFNNFNISTSAPSYIPKKPKYPNDPLNVLREQTNSMIRTSNGKAIPFEEPHNRINLENILRGKDKRTTLMIRHIPNKYTLQTILEDINIEFKDKYDLFYLPLDFNNNCNLGFAFINFVDSFHILGFYDYFRGKRWRRFNSEKICELAYAKFQGKKELINHFEKGSVMNFDSEDKKPLILPTPDPMPKVSLPITFFDAFLMIYPYSNYEVFEEEKKFTINSFYEF